MKYLVYLCVIFFTPTKCKNVYRFDYTYYPEVEGSFKVNIVPDVWPSASHRCVVEGSGMAWPRDKKFLDKMTSIMQANDISRIFIGVHAIFSHGDYTSIDGMPLSKMPVKWLIGEPDNAGLEENCLAVTKEGLFADVNCSIPHAYMCFKEHGRNIAKNQCGTVDPDYAYNVKTKSCYKLHTELNTWRTAYKTCHAEGGHLVIINDDEEGDEVLRMISKGLKYDSSGCRDFSEILDHAYTGLVNWGQYGWHTVYGDTSYKTPYSKCDKFTPPPLADEVCGSLQMETFHVVETRCHMKLPFICEKIPDSLTNNKGIF